MIHWHVILAGVGGFALGVGFILGIQKLGTWIFK